MDGNIRYNLILKQNRSGIDWLQLFHRRRYISYVFQPLQKHSLMLEQLGVDGMSSDESGDENDQHEYQILAPLWRAAEVSPWLRMFDTVHNILRIAGDPKALQGAFPHRRIWTARKSKKKNFVAGLPRNTYDQTWVAKEQLSQYFLHPSPEHYDFSHQPDIIQYVYSLLTLFLNDFDSDWHFTMVIDYNTCNFIFGLN